MSTQEKTEVIIPHAGDAALSTYYEDNKYWLIVCVSGRSEAGFIPRDHKLEATVFPVLRSHLFFNPKDKSRCWRTKVEGWLFYCPFSLSCHLTLDPKRLPFMGRGNMQALLPLSCWFGQQEASVRVKKAFVPFNCTVRSGGFQTLTSWHLL